NRAARPERTGRARRRGAPGDLARGFRLRQVAGGVMLALPPFAGPATVRAMASRLPVLSAALILLCASASAEAAQFAQAPPSPHTSGGGESSLAPMPTPPPVQSAPPDLSQPASVPAWQPPSTAAPTAP